ncbi:MAG TPA: hypothetical protein ACFYED_06385 [Candidatus Tripitaka californicus]|uniref:hypothetical protein n=1 Tax=Candidatus Tripitaka californicus TaxID=3367616 RepID=UPI0040292163|nr:hypothetical protein [Planctomycetota bacterium]
MPELEERQAKVEGILEQVEKRVSNIELAIMELRKEIAELRREISDIRKEMSSNFRWLVGIMLTTWVTIILAILIK